MAVTATPIFIQTPKVACVSIATANTNRDGTGTIGTLYTAGSNGSKIDRVQVTAAGTTTAGVIRMFIYDGSTYYLLSEHLVSAITPSSTVAAFMLNIDYSQAGNGMYLPTGYSLRASTHNAETFKLCAFGGDY